MSVFVFRKTFTQFGFPQNSTYTKHIFVIVVVLNPVLTISHVLPTFGRADQRTSNRILSILKEKTKSTTDPGGRRELAQFILIDNQYSSQYLENVV